MFDTFNELWRELAERSVITDAEYRDTNFPQCYRTVAQFTAPFTDPANAVHRAGLRLDLVDQLRLRHAKTPLPERGRIWHMPLLANWL